MVSGVVWSSYLLDQAMVRRVPAELHVRSVASGLQSGLSHLERSLLVPQTFPQSLDVFLLVVDLLHRLGEVRLQLVVSVGGLLKHTGCHDDDEDNSPPPVFSAGS